MKNRKKDEMPVHEQYRSDLNNKKKSALNLLSGITEIISLSVSVRLFLISADSFNFTPVAVTFYLCEVLMLAGTVLSAVLEFQYKEVATYRELMLSQGIRLITGMAAVLFGLCAFQKTPGSMDLLWISIVSAAVSAGCGMVIYNSYQKTEKI